MERFDLLLKNGSCLIPRTEGRGLREEVLDVGVTGGKITALGSLAGRNAAKIIDLRGLVLAPGLIDTQVHFREPGLEHKEDLETGSRGALLGGVTAFFEMPNTNPPTTDRAAFEEKLRRARGRCHANYAFYMGGSPENAGLLAGLETLPHCSGVKVFMGASFGSLLVEEDEVLEKIFRNGRRRVAIHAEDEKTLRERKSIATDGAHARFHPQWRNEESALKATQRAVRLARKTGRRVHILHVSSAAEMSFLASQKDVATVEVLPQHLTLSAPECYERLGSFAQMNPPVRDKYHQSALWNAVTNGTVDILGSDHAPHTRAEKSKTYPQSPSGFPGVQTLPTLMLDHVNKGRLPLTRFIEMVTENPRRIFKIRGKGRIEVGFDADFTVIDMKKERRIESSWMATRCGWTPYDGMLTKGWPIMAFLGGELAMSDHAVVLPHAGRGLNFEDVP